MRWWRTPKGTLFLTGGFLLAIGLTAVIIGAPFLLPDWLYQVVYGWRFPAVSRAGDGELTDNGPREAVRRYVLDLGPVDLSGGSARTYTVAELPEETFTLGLEFSTPESEAAVKDLWERIRRGEDVRDRDFTTIDERIKERAPLGTLLGIRVVDEASQLVIQEEAPLGQWGWSTGLGRPFVYRGGQSEVVPLGQGVVTGRLIGLKADGGWGTSFRPRARGVYRITLTVVPSGPPSEDVRVRLIATGGGWK